MPTLWKKYWYRGACAEMRHSQRHASYFLSCHKYADIIWSPKHNLAYMKNPKAASTSFWFFFQQQFSDWKVTTQLPMGVYLFTFVRDPLKQKLAAFAEVDMKTMLGLEKVLDNTTTFQHVVPTLHRGQDRFMAFLDDIWQHRFHPLDARKPGHAGNQISGPLCTHPVDYFGHLESLSADWDVIQKEAKLPPEMRTKAVPSAHTDTSARYQRYQYDESVPVDDRVRRKVCQVFRSEYACLGYDSPPYCREFTKV